MKSIKNSVGKSGKAVLISFGVVFCLFALIGAIFGNDGTENTKAESSTVKNTISTTVYTTKETTASTTISEPAVEPVTQKLATTAAPATKAKKSVETTKAQENPKPAATQSQESQATVYYTKNGKCYHNENPCGNGTYYPISLQEAQSRGLKPCEKCVLH